MSFTVNRKALLDELALLQVVAEKKTTIPVLSTVRIVVADGIAQLTATDLDVSLVTQVPAAGEAWAGCVPSKQLYELTRLLSGEQVEFIPEEGRITIKWSKSRHRLMLADMSTFPQIVEPSGSKITVQGEELRRALTRVLPCVTTDEARYAMQGVKFEAKDGTLRLIATDGHRLGVASLKTEGDIDALVPTLPLTATLKTNSETVEIQANENRVTLHCGSRKISAQLIAGSFPNWEMIVPKNLLYQSEVTTEELTTALRRAGITQEETYKTGQGRILAGVKIRFQRDLLTVETDESDQGDSEELLTAIGTLNGDDITMRINSDYLMDFLRHSGRRTKFNIKNENSAVLLSDSSNFQYVVMPMRL